MNLISSRKQIIDRDLRTKLTNLLSAVSAEITVPSAPISGLSARAANREMFPESPKQLDNRRRASSKCAASHRDRHI
jgi:hypothetical protein